MDDELTTFGSQKLCIVSMLHVPLLFMSMVTIMGRYIDFDMRDFRLHFAHQDSK